MAKKKTKELIKEPQKINVWVLLEEYNLYDQQGSYIVKAFDHLPTREEIFKYAYNHSEGKAAVSDDQFYERLIHEGGDRFDSEHHWFTLYQETEA